MLTRLKQVVHSLEEHQRTTRGVEAWLERRTTHVGHHSDR